MSSYFKGIFSGSSASSGGGSPSAGSPVDEPEVNLVSHLMKVPEKFPGEFGDTDHFYVHSSVRCGGDTTPRVPSNIVLVIDVSGSMGDSVTAGNNEQTGLNILHIVKHAVNTIKEVCGEHDRLGIVKFNDRAQLVMDMNNMDEPGKRLVDETLAKLSPGGSTNIWGAVHLAFETIQKDPSATARNSFVLLLTDGVPNVDPPNGLTHINALREYKTQIGSLPGTLCTFGFGYNLESVLLRDLSNFAGGMYSFIPDAGMVGTAFINSISNIMCSAIRDVSVKFETGPDVQIVPDPQLSEEGHIIATDGCSVERTSVQAGQSYDVIKRIAVPKSRQSADAPLVEVSLSYLFVGQENRELKTKPVVTLSRADEATNYELMANLWRLRTVALLKETHTALLRSHPGSGANPIVERISAFAIELQDFIEENRGELFQHNLMERLRDLNEDIEGQVKEACTRQDYWSKWGRHYLPSLTRAHDLQQSNNFKDPGIQHYGGVLFNSVRDFADEAFSRLPPPQGNPVKVSSSSSSSVQRSAAPAAPVNMAAFNNRDAGCVHGDCAVQMADGKLKKAKYLVRGDKLSNGSIVSGVMKTICYNNEANLCQIKELLVTPYHPIKHNGKWTFPNDIISPQAVPCEALYSFLLLGNNGRFCQSLKVSGLECIALGHGIENDPVASHPFFGTAKVVNSLEIAKDWFRPDGVVTLNQANKEGTMVRDKNTGLICGLIPFESLSVVSN